MRISVVIPCHNAERWIGEALRSVGQQTLSPAEVIVVDDASTDNSVNAICRSGVDTQLISAQFRNAAAARNAGIVAAKGEWIALLDADDVWYPDHLARAAEVLRGTNDVAYRALCDELTADGVRTTVTKPQPINETRTGISHQEYIEFEDRELYFGHSSCVINRRRLQEAGGYQPAQVRRHDIDMWLRLIHKHTWAWDVVPTVAYRVDTPGSICRNYAACEEFYLRALIRNKDLYAGRAMNSLLSKIARKVMTIGFTNGTPEEKARYRELAWPYLPQHVRMAYRLAEQSPAVARKLVKLKRKVFAWRTGHRMPELTH